MSYKIAIDSPALEAGSTAIWYQKVEFFGKPKIIDADDLSKTHIHLATIKAPGLETAFLLMQGEMWGENGEANAMLQEMGLHHTSMCVGDIVVLDGEKPQVAMAAGWSELAEGSYYVPLFGEAVPLQDLKREVTPRELLTLLESEQGECFKANWNGIWDRGDSINPVMEGDGIRIGFVRGTVLYKPPFVVEALPSDTEMLLFHCGSTDWDYYEKP